MATIFFLFIYIYLNPSTELNTITIHSQKLGYNKTAAKLVEVGVSRCLSFYGLPV